MLKNKKLSTLEVVLFSLIAFSFIPFLVLVINGPQEHPNHSVIEEVPTEESFIHLEGNYGLLEIMWDNINFHASAEVSENNLSVTAFETLLEIEERFIEEGYMTVDDLRIFFYNVQFLEPYRSPDY